MKIAVQREAPPPPPVSEITLTLTPEEATALAAALAMIGREDLRNGLNHLQVWHGADVRADVDPYWETIGPMYADLVDEMWGWGR